MIKFLARRFIPNYEQIENPDTRRAYGALSGTLGVALNILLFVGKLLAGTISGSVSITADAFNNLSDAASSIVTLLGFKLAGQAPDREHPYGHGRIEYLTGLLVSVLILLMGFELAKTSVEHILHPTETIFHPLVAVILLVSIGVKLYMFFYNRSLSKLIDSVALASSASDSISDVLSTLVVLLSQVISYTTDLRIDGFCGLAVSCFILRTGVSSVLETVSPLLGEAPPNGLLTQLTDAVLGDNRILGVHDLIIHDYGPGMRMASLHVEVPSDTSLVDAHEIADKMELKIRSQFQIDCVIHIDPVDVKDAEALKLQHQVASYLRSIDPNSSIHDFRLIRGTGRTKMLFDALVSYDLKIDDQEIESSLKDYIRSLNSSYRPIIHIDKF